ncbi:hypothetical protein IV102_07050 [bacterium]|nr:hypothetical protein [bacterium]
MEISRLPSTAPAQPQQKAPQSPQPDPPKDQFQPTPPDAPKPKVGARVFATVSVTGSAGMFIGAKLGASWGNPALGFLVGTLVGGGVGLALANFAYSDPKS